MKSDKRFFVVNCPVAGFPVVYQYIAQNMENIILFSILCSW